MTNLKRAREYLKALNGCLSTINSPYFALKDRPDMLKFMRLIVDSLDKTLLFEIVSCEEKIDSSEILEDKK